jgi:hypothetical protein
MSGTVYNPVIISQADGSSNVNDTLGKAGELMVAELHGKFYSYNYRQQLYMATQPAAGVIALPTGAATASYALANPVGSGKLIVPVTSFAIVTVAAGTPVIGGYVWSLVPFNSTAVTGTAITAQSLNLSLTGGNAVGKAFTTATLPITPTIFYPFAQKYPETTVTTGQVVQNFQNQFYDGTLILPPGASMGFQQIAADTTNATFQIGVIWYEAPL